MPVTCFYTALRNHQRGRGRAVGERIDGGKGAVGFFRRMRSVAIPALVPPVLCPAVVRREFGIISDCGSQTLRAASSSLFQIKAENCGDG